MALPVRAGLSRLVKPNRLAPGRAGIPVARCREAPSFQITRTSPSGPNPDRYDSPRLFYRVSRTTTSAPTPVVTNSPFLSRSQASPA